MKKLISMYQKYMFRPILYKSVTRVSVVAVLMLLWDRYVSDGRFTMWQAPALLLGVVLLRLNSPQNDGSPEKGAVSEAD